MSAMSETPDQDAVKWEQHAWGIRVIAHAMLEEFFQDHCQEFDECCPNCQRWRALDVLTENPFVEKPLPTLLDCCGILKTEKDSVSTVREMRDEWD